jgi:formiminoglutamate deiminase
VTSKLFFDHLLLPSGWASNVTVTVAKGLIGEISSDAEPPPDAERHALGLPGMPNLHSHTFQRAIAGLTEYRALGADNFWSWREQMYRFALRMSPDDVEAAASQAFTEMLESGFTAVAEFHYLHHAPDGRPYADIAEMASRIAAAAAGTGIELLLLPVFYAHANFGGLTPTPGQRRFICTMDEFSALHERCEALAPTGIAPHSLRAVTPDELAALVQLRQNRPFHLHISEQTQEVADCMAWSGIRPIDWLLSHTPVDENWCLIHATHANAQERAGIQKSGAVVGFCPITEANLGDGIFPAHNFGGNFGIGTDSNVLIDAAQELRQLEYAQRLAIRARNVMASAATPATATRLYQRALAGGAQAVGQSGGLRVGKPASFVTLDMPALGPAAQTPETALNLAVFAARRPAIDTVWVRGQKLVTGGRHLRAEQTRRGFDAMLRGLL